MVLGLMLGTAMVGCGPNVSKGDLGTIVFDEVPMVAGTEEPYKLPDLPPLPKGSSRQRRGMPPIMPPTIPPAAPQ
jgi:hypothetical protein